MSIGGWLIFGLGCAYVACILLTRFLPPPKEDECEFPRCVEGDRPNHCGHECDKRESPYAHEYGEE